MIRSHRTLPTHCVLLTICAVPASAWAQTAPSASFAAQMASVVIPVLVVLGALLAALIFVNRRRTELHGEGPLRISQVLSVGTRERVMVIDAPQGQFVVGVTPNQITFLSKLHLTQVVADDEQ